MRTNVVSLIPQIELDIIEAYLFDKGEYEFEEYLDEAEVPEPSETSRLSVAVAQILLNRIQGTLPQTGWIDANNDARASRQEIKRHKDATKLSFSPRLICCINWADSGPGISWIEAYHITFIPGSVSLRYPAIVPNQNRGGIYKIGLHTIQSHTKST